jgi:hypothetical protein
MRGVRVFPFCWGWGPRERDLKRSGQLERNATLAAPCCRGGTPALSLLVSVPLRRGARHRHGRLARSLSLCLWSIRWLHPNTCTCAEHVRFHEAS